VLSVCPLPFAFAWLALLYAATIARIVSGRIDGAARS